MPLIEWIDKKLEDFNRDLLFQKLFSGLDVEQIARRFHFENANKGIDIVLSEDMVVQSIHLFKEGNGYKEFKDKMPMDVKFSMSRLEIKKLLGSPNRNGGGYKDILATVPNWDKYYFEGFSLHLQYSNDIKAIDLVTIGSLSLEQFLSSNLQ